jgi:hypothetical protein
MHIRSIVSTRCHTATRRVKNFRRLPLVPGPAVSQHDGMLQIGSDLLPQSLLSYVAFRVALRSTWATLDQAVSGDFVHEGNEGDGFLGEVPFLRETPLHVQLDVLAATWSRHLSGKPFTADLLDESVIYAACEYTARLAEHDPARVVWALGNGPFDVVTPVDHDLASELRGLYLRMSNEGDFLLIGQFLDLPPGEASQWKQQLGVDERRLEILFETLGRWHVSPQFLSGLSGLVTDSEAAMLGRLVGMPVVA